MKNTQETFTKAMFKCFFCFVFCKNKAENCSGVGKGSPRIKVVTNPVIDGDCPVPSDLSLHPNLAFIPIQKITCIFKYFGFSFVRYYS